MAMVDIHRQTSLARLLPDLSKARKQMEKENELKIINFTYFVFFSDSDYKLSAETTTALALAHGIVIIRHT